MVIKLALRVAYQLNRIWCFLTRPLTVSVKLLLFREGRCLMVRHSYQSGWHLPGGGVKRGETLEQAARREAREELGAVLKDLRFWGIYTNFGQLKSDHLAVFVSEDFHLPAQYRDAEIEEIAFFAAEALPETQEANQRRIQEYLRGEAHSGGNW